MTINGVHHGGAGRGGGGGGGGVRKHEVVQGSFRNACPGWFAGKTYACPG